MNNVYEYLLTIFKLLVGLVTTEKLIYAALIALGVYIVWIVVSLLSSFQRKFNTNCSKVYNFLKKNDNYARCLNFVNDNASKISSGFAHGWKTFKTSTAQKPSEIIKRQDALDVEVNGGVLNQGKTLMRAYINILTVLLFIVNLAYRGSDSKITAYLIAETMVLPFIFYAVMKIFYFLYTSVKHQLYKMDIESFYDLLDLMDTRFKGGRSFVEVPVQVDSEIPVSKNSEEDETLNLQKSEVATGEEVPEVEEAQEETPAEEEEEPEEEEKLTPEELASQKYDFFKRKNIDVDKLVSEVPTKQTKTSLPYINVDSEYVIEDEKEEAVSTIVGDVDNGSELLGGMMQDRSSIKKATAEVEKKEEVKHEEPTTETQPEKKVESSDPFSTLNAFEVAENKSPATPETAVQENTTQESDTQDTEKALEKTEESNVVNESNVKTQDDNAVNATEKTEESTESMPEEETPVDSQVENQKPEVIVSEPPVEDKKADIASIVGGIKANKSKLSTGGIVIERNTPISRREQPSTYSNFQSNNNYGANSGITKLDIPDETNDVLNAMKNTNSYDNYDYNQNNYGNYGGYNQNYSNYGANQGYSQQMNPMGTGYSVPTYQGAMTNQYSGYGSVQYNNGFNQMNQNSYNPVSQSTPVATYEEPEDDFVEDIEPQEISEKPAKKPAKKVVRSKEDEPRPRNLRKKEEKVESMEEKKTRGRPKKQVFDETLTIKNDKEFDSVLARAEKLMRKSEEGLSQSQSKRIEKELKMLMDAMNKYKEEN